MLIKNKKMKNALFLILLLLTLSIISSSRTRNYRIYVDSESEFNNNGFLEEADEEISAEDKISYCGITRSLGKPKC